jgi:putative ABC transport system permease protein
LNKVNTLATNLAKLSSAKIGLSLLIAFPVSYYFINNWLNNFNERINQSFIIYIAAAIVVGLVTWFTVAAIALRTGSVKPSSSL